MKKLFLTTAAAAVIAAASAFAQTTAPTPTTPSTPSTPPAAMPPATMPAPSASAPSTATPITLTEQQAKDWVDKVVYSSDGKNVGEVAAFVRDSSGKVSEMHIDIGGLMGIGETRVRLVPTQFRLATDRVTVSLSEAQIKALPPIAK